jgi:hypothetical protein
MEVLEMKKMRAWLAGILLGGALLVGLSSCGAKGEDGEAYLGLDWTYTPLTVDFPMLPTVVGAGTYYPHPPGTYYGEYTAWSGDFYSFWYTIEINEGSYGVGGWPGEDGADRFYSIILRSWGPELYYVDVEQRSLSSAAATASDPSEEDLVLRLEAVPDDSRSVTAQKRDLDLDGDKLGTPEEFGWEQSGPGWTFSVEGQHYPVVK